MTFTVHKPRRTLRLGRVLLTLIWKASPLLLLALLLMTVLTGVTPLASMVLSAQLLNALATSVLSSRQPAALPANVVVFVLVIGGVTLLSQLTFQAQNAVRTLYQTRLTNFIQRLIAAKASALDLSFFEEPALQNKLSNASMQATYRPLEIIMQATTAVSSLITFVSVSAVLAVWHLWLLPLLLGPSLLLFGVNLRFSRKKANLILGRTPLERRGQYFYSLLTTDFFAKEIRVFSLSAYFLGQHQRTLKGMYQQDRALAARQLVVTSPVQVLLISIQTACTLFILAHLLDHTLNFGQYSLYTQSVTQLNGTFLALVLALAQLYEANLFLTSLFDFLALEATVEHGTTHQPLKVDPSTLVTPRLEFRDVTFRYPETEHRVLDQLTFTLYPGEVMALVGKNGAGKTTLVKLLAGLYHPTQGQILVDGVDITTLDRETLRAYLGVLFQDYPVYHLSAAQNIGVGHIDQIDNRTRIEAAARRSGFDHVIEALPGRFDTILGRWLERGQELSGGQRQLAGLARALMRDAPILILDEPTAALDPQNEWRFFQDLLGERRVRNQSAMFISHRFSSVRHADRILVLDHGKKIEEGNHQELLERKGMYAEMFRMQAQMYQEIAPMEEIAPRY